MPHRPQTEELTIIVNGLDLKKLRERLLIGKTELSRMSGVSLASICRIEKGGTCLPATRNRLLQSLQDAVSAEDIDG